jgi:peptidoglycan hydrolase-like protein with peptidoglycan-binding domain
MYDIWRFRNYSYFCFRFIIYQLKPFFVMIQQGSQGPEVRAWQEYLASFDEYDVDVDGIFGPKTRAATVSFQQWCNLPADGIVGANTYKWAAANGYDGGYTA